MLTWLLHTLFPKSSPIHRLPMEILRRRWLQPPLPQAWWGENAVVFLQQPTSLRHFTFWRSSFNAELLDSTNVQIWGEWKAQLVLPSLQGHPPLSWQDIQLSETMNLVTASAERPALLSGSKEGARTNWLWRSAATGGKTQQQHRPDYWLTSIIFIQNWSVLSRAELSLIHWTFRSVSRGEHDFVSCVLKSDTIFLLSLLIKQTSVFLSFLGGKHSTKIFLLLSIQPFFRMLLSSIILLSFWLPPEVWHWS